MTEQELADLGDVAQAEMDDASHDYAYVNSESPSADCGALRMSTEGAPEEVSRRVEALKLCVVQAGRMVRANGGRGRPMVGFVQGADYIEARWCVARSPAEVFSAIKELSTVS